MNGLSADSADENEVKDEQSGADYTQAGEEEPTDGADQFDGDKSGQQRYAFRHFGIL